MNCKPEAQEGHRLGRSIWISELEAVAQGCRLHLEPGKFLSHDVSDCNAHRDRAQLPVIS